MAFVSRRLYHYDGADCKPTDLRRKGDGGNMLVCDFGPGLARLCALYLVLYGRIDAPVEIGKRGYEMLIDRVADQSRDRGERMYSI